MKETSTEHVEDLLSGYLDNELTQQQAQRVRLHCDECEMCRQDLQSLLSIKQRVAESRLAPVNQDTWRESVNDTISKTSLGIGWLLFLGGVLASVGFAVFGFLFGTALPWGPKAMVIAIYAGLAGLFIAVLRQRLLERKTDKYKDVEI